MNKLELTEFPFKRATKFFLFALVITTISTVTAYVAKLDLVGVIEALESSSIEQENPSTGIMKVWSYIFNNGLKVPIQMLMLSLIPIKYLYMINILLTVSLPGIVYGSFLQIDKVKGFQIIVSSIPYYIFEIFAFCLFAAVLFELNQVVRIKFKSIFKGNKNKEYLKPTILKTLKSYSFIVLPLIILAAFSETYLANIIIELFQ